MSVDYIRTHYKVPARRGGKVVADGKPGTIIGTDGAHLRVRLNGETNSRPWHPTWHMRYLGANGNTIWWQPCGPDTACDAGSTCRSDLRHGMGVTIPDAGNYCDEDAYNIDTEKFNPRKIKVVCPGCGQTWAPLCSPVTVVKDSGLRWVGCDHKEPYAVHQTRHGGSCGLTFTFTTYTPQ